MVKENARLKIEIAIIRKHLQDKELAQGQTKGSTFSPRIETTQVQTEQLVDLEERPSFQDVPMGQDLEQPQEETHTEIERE